ncbi:hypothetical protein Hdeb2414_s0010g00342541 [Helianthus debilis subsp. tardiflorus]
MDICIRCSLNTTSCFTDRCSFLTHYFTSFLTKYIEYLVFNATKLDWDDLDLVMFSH